MSTIFTNNGIREFQKNIETREAIEQFKLSGNVDIPNFIPIASLNLGAASDYILTMKNMLEIGSKKNSRNDETKDQHKAMDTPAAKHLFYYINSFTGQDAIDAKAGLSSKDIIQEARKIDSLLYQYVTDRSYNENLDAYNTALKEGLTVFDLETLGDGFITDFHFEQVGPNGYNASKRNYYSSALGISEHQAEEYRKLAKKWAIEGESALSKDDIVTLKRLNKIGSSNTKIVDRDTGKALYRYETLDSIEILSKDRIAAGIDKLFKIGEAQAKSTVNGIRPAVQEMIDGIFSSKVLGGQNIKDFDMPVLHEFLTARDADGKLKNVSQEEYEEYSRRLAIGRPKLLDSLELARRMDKKTPLQSSYEMLINPAFDKHKVTSNKQAALVIRAGHEELLKNAHLHAAEHDVELWIKGIYQGGYFDKDNANYFFKDKVGEKTNISVGSIFSVGKDFKANEALNSGLVFMKDGLNNDIRFNNGMVYRQGKEHFVQNTMSPFESGMNYMLSKIGEVSTAENKELEKIGISGKKLFAASFAPMVHNAAGDERYAGYQDSTVTIVAESKEELEEKIANLVYVGKRKGLNKTTEDILREEANKGILSVDIAESAEGNPEFQRIAKQYDSEGKESEKPYNEVLNYNAKTKIEEDRPARKVREVDNKHAKKELEYSAKMAKNVSQNKTATLSHSDVIDIVSYSNHDRTSTYYQSNSIRNLLFGQEYNKIFLSAKEAVLDRTRSMNQAADAYEYVYNHVMASIMDRAGIKKIHPAEERPLTIDDLNTFDIDISRWQKNIGKSIQTFSLDDPGHPGIVSIRIDKADHGFTNRLIQALHGESGNKFEPAERKTILRQLMSKMNKNIKKDLFNIEKIDFEKTSEEGILRYISAALSDYVEEGNANGSPVKRHLYKRTKQVLDPEESEFVQKKVFVKDSEGNYHLNSNFGKLDDYIDNALADYKKALEQHNKDTNEQIDDIIEILFKDSDVDKKKLIDFGYTSEQADILLEQRRLRKRDTKNYVQEIFGTFLNNNPSAKIQIDKSTGEILISTQDEQIRGIEKYLPKDIYREKTGRFETRLGRMNIVNAIGVYDVTKYGSDKKQFAYGTHLMHIASQNTWIRPFLNAAKGQEGSLGKLEYALKVINKDLRKIKVGPGTSAYANFASLADNIPELIKSGVITNEYVEQELIDKASKFKGKDEVASFNLIQRNMRGILEAIADRGLQYGVLDKDSFPESIRELARNIYIGDKPIAHWNAETVTIEGYVTADNRGIGSVNQRAIEVDTNAIDDAFVNAPDELKKSVKDASNIFRTKAEVSREAGGQAGYRKNISIRRINTDHSYIRELVDGSNLSDFSKTFIRNSIYTKEGGAVINPYLADTLYSQRDSDQKIGELADIRILDKAEQENELERRLRQSYEIHFDSKTGEYKFNYGIGRYVQTNDVIGYTHDKYNEVVRAKKAKYAGVVKRVFFDRETQRMVSEDIINDVIKGWLIANKAHVEKYDSRRIQEDITKHLQTMFEEKTINTSFSANQYFKMVEAQTEKGMHFSPIVGLGRLDSRIAQLLDDLNLGFLKGQTLSKEALSWLFDDPSYMGLRQLAAKHGVGFKTVDTNNLIKNAFGSRNDLLKAITEERYKVWNDLVDVLGKGKDIGVISNTAAEALKHGEFRGAMNYLLGQIEGLSDENTRKEFLSRVNAQEVFGKNDILSYSDTDGFIFKEQPTIINVDKLKGIVKDVTGQDLDTATGKYFSGMSAPDADSIERVDSIGRRLSRAEIEKKALYEDRVLLERAKDHEHASFASIGKGFKYTERDVNNMAVNVFDDASMKTAREVLAKAGGADLAESVFKGKKAGDAVYHETLLNLKERNFAQDYKNLIVRGGRIDYENLEAFADEKGIDKKVLGKIISSLTEPKDKKFTPVRELDENFLERAYTADMHLRARGYNLNAGLVSEKSLTEDFGFKKINIKNLVTHFGSSKMFDDSMFGKNMLIDLSGFGVSTSKGLKSIAIPMLSSGFMADNKEASNEVLMQLRRLHGKAQEYLETEDLEQRAAISQKMQSAVNELEDKLSRLHGKEGPIADLGAVRLMHSSSSAKSDYIDLRGAEGNWKIRGKSVTEMANKGFEAHVAFVGENQLREMLGEDYFKNLKNMGISEEDYFKHIEEHGILGTVNRKPSGYLNSMATARIYLDRNIGNSELIRVSEPLGFLMKNDLDGDILGVSILTQKGQTKGGSLIHVDSAVHDLASSGRTDTAAAMVLTEGSLNKMGETFTRMEDSHLFVASTIGRDMMENVRKIQSIGKNRNLVEEFLIDGTFYANNYGADRKKYDQIWKDMGQHDAFRDIMSKSRSGELLDFKNAMVERINQTDAFDKEDAKIALSQFMHDEFDRRAIMTYAGKQGTGLVNEYAQRFRTIQSWLVQTGESGLTTRQSNIIASSLITLEDKFFASKNAEADMTGALEKFGNVVNRTFKNNNPDELINFMINDFNILNEKWMTKQFGMQGISQEEFAEAFRAFLPKGKEWNSIAIDALRTGMGQGKFSSNKTFVGPNAMYSAQATTLQAFSTTDNELLHTVENVYRTALGSSMDNLGEFDLSSAIPDDLKQKQTKASLMDAIKNIRIGGSGSLSKSAVGIAGSIMLAGFIGGNPSRDEDEIAMHNQAAHQRSGNTVPNFAGYNQQEMNPQQKSYKGYRINVTASSPYEQQQSMNAVRQSFQGNINSNINMNINIQNNQYGPSDRDVESYFEGLL